MRVVREGKTPVLHATPVRGDDVVVEVDAERIDFDEVVALGTTPVRRYRPAALVEPDVTCWVNRRLVPEIPSVVLFVELAQLVLFVFWL